MAAGGGYRPCCHPVPRPCGAQPSERSVSALALPGAQAPGRQGLSIGSSFAGDIKYDEAMGYPMVQHWRVRSNLYRVKLSSITLSAGEGF